MTIMKFCAAAAAAASLAIVAVPATAQAPNNQSVKNIVLVHGAWVDASGWKPVYDILSKEGFQRHHGAGARDIIRRRRRRDQAGARSAGRSDAARRPQLWRLDHHRGRRPSEGRRAGLCRRARARRRRGRKRSSARRRRAFWPRPRVRSRRRRTALPISIRRSSLKLFAPDLPRERAEFAARSQVLAARRRLQHAADGRGMEDEAELGNRRRQRSDHQSRSRALVLRPRQQPHAPRSRAPATPSTSRIRRKSRP